MNIICEECGKIYQIDRDKLARLMNNREEAIFKCKVCGHGIPVSLAQVENSEQQPEAAAPAKPSGVENGFAAAAAVPDMAETPPEVEAGPEVAAASPGKAGLTLGLRTKMFILFLVIPVFLIAVFGFISNRNMKQMLDSVISKSADTITSQGEMEARKIARFVAVHSYSYLLSHPLLKKEFFNFDREFKRIAVQKVGTGGHTMIAEIGAGGGLNILAHSDSKYVGPAGLALLKKKLGAGSAEFLGLVRKARGGKESYGLFSMGGQSNYMVITPIKDTSFSIIGVTSRDQYLSRIRSIQDEAQFTMDRLTRYNFLMMAVSVLVIGLIISVYGHTLTKKISMLTHAADRISVGELDVEIDKLSGDEIGQLGEAVARMQDSLRLSIERLRRKR